MNAGYILITEIHLCSRIKIFVHGTGKFITGNIIKKKICNKLWTKKFMNEFKKRIERISEYNINLIYKEK